MKTLIRGKPPWYARGIPVIKLRDGPELKIRGKPGEVGRRKLEDACLPVGSEVEVQKARGRPPMGKCVNAGKHELSSRQGTGRDLPQREADLSLFAAFRQIGTGPDNVERKGTKMKYLTLSKLVPITSGSLTLTGWKKQTCQRSQNLTTSNKRNIGMQHSDKSEQALTKSERIG